MPLCPVNQMRPLPSKAAVLRFAPSIQTQFGLRVVSHVPGIKIFGTAGHPLIFQRVECTAFLYLLIWIIREAMEMLVGYARVSANHQNLDRQLAMLKAAGCKRVFKEKKFGREGVRRPELERAIEVLGQGDVLVLAEWDRATRSMMDGIRIIERVAARGAMLKALDRQWLDLTTPIGKGILAFLSALAEDERSRILARANGGRAAAKKRGYDLVPNRD